jgi:hypothetical protein
MADGTNLGEREGCTSWPQWAFASSQLRRTLNPATRRDPPHPATRRDALAFDVATGLRPWLVWALAVIAAGAFALAHFGRERLTGPVRRVLESSLAVPVLLATVNVKLAVASGAAILIAAWYEHRHPPAIGGADVAPAGGRPDPRQASKPNT